MVAMKIASLLSKLAFTTLLAASPCAFADIIISIDQTGANIPISTLAPRVWNITLTSSGTFDSALFSAKLGNGVTTPLDFTVYSGFGGSFSGATALYTSELLSSQFSQSYQVKTFSLNDLVLGPGNYSLELSSLATGGGTDQYFIKSGSNGGQLTFTDSVTGTTSAIVQQGSNNISNSSTASAPVVISPVPEPSTMLLGAGVGALFLTGALRRRNKTGEQDSAETAALAA
jgi:hypothetical protein